MGVLSEMCEDKVPLLHLFFSFWKAGDRAFKLNRNSALRFFWGLLLLAFFKIQLS